MATTKTANGKTTKNGSNGATTTAPSAEVFAEHGDRPVARTTLEVHGARVHNLRDLTIELPRDALVVVTGLSGSGKSSLAFDTLYAEGQRRYMESLSTYAKRFMSQVAKPDVDYVFGLSPVISIEQKTIAKNPRSTVGTLTDIAGYLNLLYATVATPHCPRCDTPVPALTAAQVRDRLMTLPEGTEVELRAPVFPLFGEEPEVLFSEVRRKGYRRLRIGDTEYDLSEEFEADFQDDTPLEVVVDRFVIAPQVDKQLKAGIQSALLIGDQAMSAHIVSCPSKKAAKAFEADFGCPEHHIVYADIGPDFFMFNNPESACRTCGGLGIYKQVHPDLLVPDKSRSVREGCFVRDAFNYNPESWAAWIMHSVALHHGFDLDTPFDALGEAERNILLYGNGGEKFPLQKPPDAKNDEPNRVGKMMGFRGVARQIEGHYKRYREKDVAHSGMEAWLSKVMVEHTCPDCEGSRLKATRLKFLIDGVDLFGLGDMHFEDVRAFLDTIQPPGKSKDAGQQVIDEVSGRLDLLLGIGLDYLSFNRSAGTLSGGEAQRIRLSTQIGSGLMGMLYVLDEPSIGLHPKDNRKMIGTLRRLRDLGNTVIVVEHDEDTIRTADHVVEMGPGAGVHGGDVVVQGTLHDILACPESPTGQYLSGAKQIATPAERRKGNGKELVIRGARENNLADLDVTFPLGQFIAVTGASGSGKSTLVNTILCQRLRNHLEDSRILFGDHDDLEGLDEVSKLTVIDQSPLGRNSRSNPATYMGFFDNIRKLFAATETAKERGYKPGRFSFNVAGGRCEDCSGEGTITTQLYFMPDVEVLCGSCKGARYNPDTLEVQYNHRSIAEVLDMTVEEGVEFFDDQKAIGRKVAVLDELGLGYLTLGQSSTTLSGGEAQRVKLATELSKLRRGAHTVYVLDEPTTGLHLADVARLLDCLHRLVDAGHTVIVIEHHMDVVKTADWVIDLGPEGGHRGGQVVAAGTPEEVAACEASHTGRFLAERL